MYIMIIKAPTRIDLAGGTLDIWPLSVKFAPAVCVNLAISLYATVEARKMGGKGVAINALHLGKKLAYAPGVSERKKTLFHRALDIFPVSGWELIVNCHAPAGSGLGGSSALLIALLRTLASISGKNMSKNEILETAKNLEARHLGIPTGTQDYIAALNGGVNVVKNSVTGQTFSRMRTDSREIAERILLVYSGKSRISGEANWHMFKRCMENEPETTRIFSNIAQNSLLLEKAVSEGRLSDVGPLMEKENAWREKLGREVIPAGLKKIFPAIRKAGGYPKICGAGGGGCFAVWCEPGQREKLGNILTESGMKPLDFTAGTPSKST